MSNKREIKAVIFDMFETLITHYESFLYFAKDIADDVNIPAEEFVPLWLNSEDARTLGLMTFEEALEGILIEYDCFDEELIRKVSEKRTLCKIECLKHLHPQIIPMLKKLKENDIRIGLITNCYLEEEEVLRKSVLAEYFNVSCYSCRERLMKPDIKIFDRCLKRLNVTAQQCLFVSDGGSYELETAKEMGMKTLQATWYFKEGTFHFVDRKEEFRQAAEPMDVITFVNKANHKKLSEMSIEELWQLFPIFLVEHNTNWKQYYNQEKEYLQSILGETAVISHIGSTAIDNIMAKNIVDILVEIPLESDIKAVKRILAENGYICMSEEEKRISFNKGYTEEGFADKVFHIHVRYKGDNDEIIFRDYLNNHPEKAKQYEQLKLELWKKYEHDRDSYTQQKSEFVNEVMALARSGN